jgi:hypothetical protein
VAHQRSDGPSARRDGSGIELASGRSDDDEDWGMLLTRAKADAERRVESSEDDEWEWAAQMQRVKAQLSVNEDDEWRAAVARARALTAQPVSRPVVSATRGDRSSVRARTTNAPAPQKSAPRQSVLSDETPPSLYFTLPGEKAEEPAKLPEEVSKVVARSSITQGPRTGTHAVLPERTASVPQQPIAPKPVEKPVAAAPIAPKAEEPKALEAPRTSLTAVPPRTSLAAVPPKKGLPEVRRTSLPELSRASSELKPEPAPSKSKQSSPGMAALRVAATKRSTETTPRASQTSYRATHPSPEPLPAPRASKPAKQEPKKKDKDSSLVGLSVALVESMQMAQRVSRGAPPPPPPAAYAQRGTGMPMRAPEPRSSRAPLKIPAPPPRSSSVPARQPLKIPAPPPPSSAKQGVPERVVSRVRNAVAALTRRGGVRG